MNNQETSWKKLLAQWKAQFPVFRDNQPLVLSTRKRMVVRCLLVFPWRTKHWPSMSAVKLTSAPWPPFGSITIPGVKSLKRLKAPAFQSLSH